MLLIQKIPYQIKLGVRKINTTREEITAASLLQRKGDLSYGVVFAHTTDNIWQCAKKMKTHGVGSLLVRDNEGHTIGIITERDFVEGSVTMDKPLQTRNVKELMTPVEKLIRVPPNTNLQEMLEIMKKYKIRHLPVMSENNILGMVSIRDILLSILDVTHSNSTMKEEN